MKIVIKKSDAQDPYSFSFVNDEGKALVRSQNYASKSSAQNGAESVKKNCMNDDRYELKEAKNGSFFFNIKASNGQIVGTSMMFASLADRNSAVSQLKNKAQNAPEVEE